MAILLPGLDGSGKLFERFVAAAPATPTLRVQPLPSDRPRSYRELADELAPSLPHEPFALIAESFSGPLAVLLASRVEHVRAVVLCATFVRAPLPSFLARLPGPFWRSPPPQLLLEAFLTGGDTHLAVAVQDAVAPLDALVLRARVAAALTVDVTRELERLTQPLLYLRAESDRVVRRRCGEVVAETKPSATVASLDAPHLVLQTRPHECWSVIAPFLERAFARRVA